MVHEIFITTTEALVICKALVLYDFGNDGDTRLAQRARDLIIEQCIKDLKTEEGNYEA